MSRPRPLRVTPAAALVLTLVLFLLVLLSGCKSEDTRQPNDSDVVRAPANTSAPCRCGDRPTLGHEGN